MWWIKEGLSPYKIIKGLGSAEDVEPFPLFTSQKHGDILVVGRYPENETFGGTDRLSYKTIKLFREFLNIIPNSSSNYT